MDDREVDEIVRDDHDAIVAAVQERMRGDEAMVRMAGERGLSESDLAAQVLGFWLQGIASDLTLGSTAAMRQNMDWLIGFREGHGLRFENEMVHRFFREISGELKSRLSTQESRQAFAAYESRVAELIARSFPL